MTTITSDLQARLAEYHVLATYDRLRSMRYGDMAALRRGRELDRLADALIDAGVPVDRRGQFPTSDLDDLRAAFERVARPRIRRIEREDYRHGTYYTRATLQAWRATWMEITGLGYGALLTGDVPVFDERKTR